VTGKNAKPGLISISGTAPMLRENAATFTPWLTRSKCAGSVPGLAEAMAEMRAWIEPW
jgi:hypothetical protein